MDIQQFFEPLSAISGTLPYEDVGSLIKMADIVSRAGNVSVYIIDYARQEFLHVSPHPLFLAEYSQEDVKAMGYAFYEKVVSPEEQQMLFEINKMGFEHFYRLSVEQRENMHIAYNFHLNYKNNGRVLIQHKLTPLRLTPDGNLWLAICFVSNSPYREAGNVIFTFYSKNEYYQYNLETHKIEPYTPKTLSVRETEILNLTMRGFDEKQISEVLHISLHTVKVHRRNIIKKMGVNNLTNAVTMYYSLV
ncbi:MAG: helix-turn-helix transcriptional regulator [Bacteroidales bacterium]|jgi:DNA-binding CsgD family transcriptional regulator|nr:helix-turn-helix transcriptional regulator [Bacteroidales bacterium]